jgi:hypothetical protein
MFSQKMSKLSSTVAASNDSDHPNHKMMITTQHHKTDKLSQQDLKELRSMSRSLQRLKRQMFLKQVEATTPVDCFRSFIVGLAVEEEALEARRERSECSSSSSRASSFDNTHPLGQIQE